VTDQGGEFGPETRLGTRIGRYRVDSLLGVGSLGELYRATAPDGRAVALRVLDRRFASDETFRRRLLREIRIAQTVESPHLVSVLEVGEHEGVPYIAQLLIDGRSLDDRLHREGTLDVATTIQICAQIADALEALWRAGIVHRDVKPANILLDRAENAFLTDFGLAKDTQANALTMPGQALGSMDYMAPEQVRGEQVTAATDIYGLGCVIFECLEGRAPFADRQGMRVLWAQLQQEPPDPGAARDDVSPALARAVKLALRKDPAERPQSASDYTRALSQAAGIALSEPGA
jgi:serine/threonine protein kinase